MFDGFFKGKRVFVTGHTGFKGAWLCLLLKLLGADVCGYSLSAVSEPDMYGLIGIESDITSVYGNICDLGKIEKSIRDYSPEIIINLAAQSLVRRSYKNPVETFETNIMGTVHVLESSRKVDSVRVILNITSDKCYENKEWLYGYRENDPMGGHDPYSCSKGCSELITTSYINSFFKKESSVVLASARAGNVIGGGDFAEDRLIPDMVRSFLKNKPVKIRNPNATRPWQHVLEPLFGYLTLIKKMYEKGGRQYEGGWNFGPDNSGVRNVGSIVEDFKNYWGENAKWINDDSTQLHEANLLKLDCSKAQAYLGWQTKLNIEQSLKWTVEWYKEFRDNPANLCLITEKQIMNYYEI